MALIDLIKSANEREIKSHVVPEWENTTVYFYSVNAKDLNDLQRKHPAMDIFKAKFTLESLVDIIIQKAMDIEGKKLFTLEHKPELMRSSVGVIANLGGAILETASSTTVEDAEKN